MDGLLHIPHVVDDADNYNNFEYARYRHTISDGDVVIEKGRGSPPCLLDMRLADALVGFRG